MKLIHRYLVAELWPSFLFGLAIFTTLLLSAGVLFRLGKVALEYHVPLNKLVFLFFLSIPKWITYALPLSVLLAGLISLGRLSQDQEILAFKALGIPLTECLYPLTLFGGIVTISAFILQEAIAPASQLRFERELAEITKGRWGVKENLVIQLKKGENLSFYLYARIFNFETRELKDTFFVNFQNGEPIQTVKAEKGYFIDDTWEFENGRITQFAQEGNVKRQGEFERQKFKLPLKADEAYTSTIEPENLNVRQMKKHIAFLAKQGLPTRDLEVDYYWHFSIPLASLIFALFCLPLSLLLGRQSHALGLGLSAVVTFFYYLFMNFGNILGKQGRLPPALAAFLPNLLFLFAGMIFLRKANR